MRERMRPGSQSWTTPTSLRVLVEHVQPHQSGLFLFGIMLPSSLECQQ